jgi:hypothetical protein
VGHSSFYYSLVFMEMDDENERREEKKHLVLFSV